MNQYDFIIIGGGLGGLTSAAILSKNGFSVCLLEKNPFIGGCLLSYHRGGAMYETGVHYIGSMDKGQILNKIFSYTGILPYVDFERLNMNAFDRFTFGNDPQEYGLPQGYEEFIRVLSERFPNEKAGIKSYCRHIRDVCSKFPLYTYKAATFSDKLDVFYANAHDMIASHVDDPLLRAILAGNNPLYAGVVRKTPLYVHALIINSFIESSWRCKDGGISIAKALVKVIKINGGTILTGAEVTSLEGDGIHINKAVAKSGEEFQGKNFISSLHPAVTLSLTKSTLLRPVFRKRISDLENTISPFILNIRFKENSFPFLNYNHYHYKTMDVWNTGDYTPDDWPRGIVFFTSTRYEGTEMTKTGCVMAYMKFADVNRWSHTFNTVYNPSERGKGYDDFKSERAERLLSMVITRYPDFKASILDTHTATPLTFRDYFGNPEGSLYGVLKDCEEPLKSYFPANTKIPNLFLTGQSLSVHGVLGVTMSAIITCGEFIGIDKILDDVKNS